MISFESIFEFQNNSLTVSIDSIDINLQNELLRSFESFESKLKKKTFQREGFSGFLKFKIFLIANQAD